MSMNLMVKVFDKEVGNPTRKLVLLKLADNANDQGECFPSHKTIARQCEIGISTVKGHIKALVDMGYLTITHRVENGVSRSNLYHLTIENGRNLSRPVQVRKKASDNAPAHHDDAPSDAPTPNETPDAEAPDANNAEAPDAKAAPTADVIPANEPLDVTVSATDESEKKASEQARKALIDEGFAIFYNAGLRKKSRQKAEAAFKKQAAKHADPVAFARMIAENIKGRLGTGELGFDNMHPSTYLNQQRWQDEVGDVDDGCPCEELFSIFADVMRKHGLTQKVPKDFLMFKGTRGHDYMRERWHYFMNTRTPNGKLRYDDEASGIDYWTFALDHIASKANFRQSDITIATFFQKDVYAHCANGTLRQHGAAR